MPQPAGSAFTPTPPALRRAQRRDARRTENRTVMLDAAERVFGEYGIREGSLRQIADEAGFSTAAIYLFFENKQHLLSETLTRLWNEINGVLREAADTDLPPLPKIHALVDATGVFFARRPHFRQLMHQISSGAATVEPALAEYAEITRARFVEALAIVVTIIREGQATGDIRDGHPDTLALFYSVLVNEHFRLAAQNDVQVGPLTTEQFRSLLDGALRAPPAAPTRPRSNTATRTKRAPTNHAQTR